MLAFMGLSVEIGEIRGAPRNPEQGPLCCAVRGVEEDVEGTR